MASWVERLKTKFTITMGDGVEYAPLYMNANKNDEFNVAEFNFRNLDGTLVERRRRMGTVYALELIFQGGDNIDVARRFQKSSWNSKPWTIKHPLYDTLTVQPITAVNYDNDNNLLNITRIRVTVRETISQTAITNVPFAPDAIATNGTSNAKHFADYYVTAVPAPRVKDINQMKSNLSGFQRVMSTISTGANDIKNAYNSAFAAVNNAAHDVSAAISQVQFFLSLPALIEDNIINRVNYVVNEYLSLADQVANLHTVPLKALWFNNAGTCINAMCVASITNIQPTDYAYSSQVLQVISKIVTSYNDYLQHLDTIQTINGGEPDSFTADPLSFVTLDDLVGLTLATLFDIQASSKQPRMITLTKDNNVINVAWQIYGLLPDDSTIDRIMTDNNIGGDEIWQLPKGKQILYYA